MAKQLSEYYFPDEKIYSEELSHLPRFTEFIGRSQDSLNSRCSLYHPGMGRSLFAWIIDWLLSVITSLCITTDLYTLIPLHAGSVLPTSESNTFPFSFVVAVTVQFLLVPCGISLKSLAGSIWWHFPKIPPVSPIPTLHTLPLAEWVTEGEILVFILTAVQTQSSNVHEVH